MYGLLITAAGWAYEYIDDLGMDRAVEYLGYLQDCPPEHVILNALHNPKQGKQSKHVSTGNPERDERQELRAMAAEMGADAKINKFPPHLKELMEWVEANSPTN